MKDVKKRVLKLILHENTKILAIAAGSGFILGFLLGRHSGKKKTKKQRRKEKMEAFIKD